MNALGSIAGTLGSVRIILLDNLKLTCLTFFQLQVPCIVCCPNPYKRIDQGYVGLISRFGKFYKCSDPGLIKVGLSEIPSKVMPAIAYVHIEFFTDKSLH